VNAWPCPTPNRWTSSTSHHDQPAHHVDQECTIHCLEGDVEVVTPAGTRRLRPGNLLVLPARQKHSLRARTHCAVLVTLLLRDGDAGSGGGAGARSLEQDKA
jgi:quercetin dioxygenase-like cupin family protein